MYANTSVAPFFLHIRPTLESHELARINVMFFELSELRALHLA